LDFDISANQSFVKTTVLFVVEFRSFIWNLFFGFT